MREADSRAETYDKRYRELAPPFGSIAVGGAAWDEFGKANAIREFLRSIRNGKDIQEALVEAKMSATDSVQKWNASRGKDYHTHRAKTMFDSLLFSLSHTFQDAIQSKDVPF